VKTKTFKDWSCTA